MKKDCPKCNGYGEVCDSCGEDEDSNHEDCEDAEFSQCDECSGSGKQ